MPKIMNKNYLINYLEWGQQDRPALILVFGFGMSALDWYELGYIKLLEPHFHVIAIEPRGHGLSDVALQSDEYTLAAMASDIDAVIIALRLEKIILWGYSLGAKIILAYAGQAENKNITSLVLGGFELHSKVDLPSDLVANILNKTGKDWLVLWQSMFNVPPSLATRLSQANLPSLRALREAEACWPDLIEIPKKISVPCLLYAGEYCFFKSQVVEMVDCFKQAEYLERKNRNHFELMLDPDWICEAVINRWGIKED